MPRGPLTIEFVGGPYDGRLQVIERPGPVSVAVAPPLAEQVVFAESSLPVRLPEPLTYWPTGRFKIHPWRELYALR